MTNGEEREQRPHDEGEELPPLREPGPVPHRVQRFPQQQQQEASGEGGGAGWLWFILIFGVGNFILYKTTGFLIIPIRR